MDQYCRSEVSKIAKELSKLEMVKAVALSGSKTSAINDGSSDWDIYIYSDKRVPLEERKRILSSLGLSSSIDVSPFEEGDEAVGEDGTAYDLMYRSISWTENEVDDVLVRCNARLGYTTCFLYNIATSMVLFDTDNWLEGIQERINSGYPEKLRANIIRKNLDIIDGSGASTYLIQAELAAKRNDLVSANHRLSAILASYFDILFAYNKVLHPGEKKLERYAHLLCKEIPDNFDEELQHCILLVGKDGHVESIKRLIDSLRMLVEK